MLITALFATGKIWNQRRCPSTDECGIYTQQESFIQPQRVMKFCHLQENGWNWRSSCWAK
jgi:hypothetical protein